SAHFVGEKSMFRTTSAVVMAVGLASVASGQSCATYWASLPIRQVPGYQDAAFASFDDGDGPTVFVGTSLATLYRWHGMRWELLTSGLFPPIPTDFHGPIVVADGDGPALYVAIRDATTWHSYRRRQGAWAQMPDVFWIPSSGRDYLPETSGDMGDGVHIYG